MNGYKDSSIAFLVTAPVTVYHRRAYREITAFFLFDGFKIWII